tara:strand:- start:8674 stop:8856 length:183 start_codon:yes stop_codon:yes gene_type:complete
MEYGKKKTEIVPIFWGLIWQVVLYEGKSNGYVDFTTSKVLSLHFSYKAAREAYKLYQEGG